MGHGDMRTVSMTTLVVDSTVRRSRGRPSPTDITAGGLSLASAGRSWPRRGSAPSYPQTSIYEGLCIGVP